jgi:hypothetical protein
LTQRPIAHGIQRARRDGERVRELRLMSAHETLLELKRPEAADQRFGPGQGLRCMAPGRVVIGTGTIDASEGVMDVCAHVGRAVLLHVLERAACEIHGLLELTEFKVRFRQARAQRNRA